MGTVYTTSSSPTGSWATAPPGTYDPACETGLLLFLLVLLWGSFELRFLPIFSWILQLLQSINCHGSKSSYNSAFLLMLWHLKSCPPLLRMDATVAVAKAMQSTCWNCKPAFSYLLTPHTTLYINSDSFFIQRIPDIQMKREPTWVTRLCTPHFAVWLCNCSQQLCHRSEFASSIHDLFLSSVGNSRT